MLDGLRARELKQLAPESGRAREDGDEHVLTVERLHNRNTFKLEPDILNARAGCGPQGRDGRRPQAPASEVDFERFSLVRRFADRDLGPDPDLLLTDFRKHVAETQPPLGRGRGGQLLDGRVARDVEDVFGKLRDADDAMIDWNAEALFEQIAHVLREQFDVRPRRCEQMNFARVPVDIFAHERAKNGG